MCLHELRCLYAGASALVPVSGVSTPAGAATGASAAAGGVKRFVRQQVPDEVLSDAALNEAIKVCMQAAAMNGSQHLSAMVCCMRIAAPHCYSTALYVADPLWTPPVALLSMVRPIHLQC